MVKITKIPFKATPCLKTTNLSERDRKKMVHISSLQFVHSRLTQCSKRI